MWAKYEKVEILNGDRPILKKENGVMKSMLEILFKKITPHILEMKIF